MNSSGVAKPVVRDGKEMEDSVLIRVVFPNNKELHCWTKKKAPLRNIKEFIYSKMSEWNNVPFTFFCNDALMPDHVSPAELGLKSGGRIWVYSRHVHGGGGGV